MTNDEQTSPRNSLVASGHSKFFSRDRSGHGRDRLYISKNFRA